LSVTIAAQDHLLVQMLLTVAITMSCYRRWLREFSPFSTVEFKAVFESAASYTNWWKTTPVYSIPSFVPAQAKRIQRRKWKFFLYWQSAVWRGLKRFTNG